MDIKKKAEEIEKATEEMLVPKEVAEGDGVLQKLIDETGKAADVMLDLDLGEDEKPGKIDQLIHEVEEAAEALLDLDK